jgi:hypothetical protein
MRRGCERLTLSVDHTPPRATALTIAHTLAPVDLIPTRLRPVLVAALSFAQPAITTLAAANLVRKATNGASLKIHRRETPGLPALE